MGVVLAHVQGYAIVLVLPEHLETTGIEILAAHGRLVAGDAGRTFHHVIDGGEVLVVHQLTGHHADRLRGFPQAVFAFADGYRAGGVGPGALGGGPQAVAGDRGGAQVQCAGVGYLWQQQPGAVALALGLQALAAQQLAEGLLAVEVAAQAWAGLAGHAAGVVRQADAGLAGELVQRVGQGAGGDGPTAGLGVTGGCVGHYGQWHCAAAQAGAEQGGLHRALEGGTLGGKRLHDRGVLLKEVNRTGLLIGLSLQVERQ